MSRAQPRSSNSLKPEDSAGPPDAAKSTFNTLAALEKVGMLQQSGKLKEAYELCREINQADPKNADAYNISGVIAFQGGKSKLGLKLLREAVAADPSHAGALNNLGIVLKEVGRADEAVDVLQQSIELNLNDADTHYNLGNALSQVNNHAEAEVAYGRAVDLRAGFVDAAYNRGIMLSTLERFGEAAEVFRQVTEFAPDFADAHLQLARTLATLESYEAALAACELAVDLRPDDVDTLLTQGNILASCRQYDDAAVVYRRITVLSADLAEAHNKLGRVLYDAGKPAEAIGPFKRALEIDPHDTHAQYSLLASALNGSGAEALLETCDARLATSAQDRYALAAKAIALNDLGQPEAARRLLDFDRFIRPVRLETPMGYPNLKAFNDALADHVCSHPTLEFEKRGHATRSGGHTGHINVKPEFPVAVLEQCIRGAVADYVESLPDDPSHPFIAGRLERWKINMWAVVMQTQGHQVPHIHPAAWLSGVYYPKLPEIIGAADSDRAGWIEFGRPRDVFLGKVEPQTALFKPEEGLMFLFPAYFFHGTIPFDSDETRVSIAFDIVPAG